MIKELNQNIINYWNEVTQRIQKENKKLLEKDLTTEQKNDKI
jgi:hypothetical protein